MDPRSALVAAKLSGKMSATVGIGRLDYIGRFQPFGQAEFDGTVHENEDGLWVVTITNAAVPYQHPSPRIITHVGMFVYDRWLFDPAPHSQLMGPSDVATFSVQYPLPESF